MANDTKRIARCNKLYPFYSGLSMDLLFWPAINTLFLTIAKGITAAQINLLVTVGLIATILLQPVILKIIKKIGNLRAIRIGTILLFCGSLTLTFAPNYILLLLGEIIYESAYLFKDMDIVILRKNLKQQGEINDFIKYQSRASMIYSITTMIVSLFAGYLFKVNEYLPMIICSIFCFINIILSFLMCESNVEEDEVVEKEKGKFSLSLIIILIFVLYGSFASIINVGQTNAKLLMQENLYEFLEIGDVAIYLTTIIFASRVVRVIANFIFPYIIKKSKENILHVLSILMVISLSLIIMGDYLNKGIEGVLLISLGFCIFLAIRDPFHNYVRTILLNSCNTKYHAQAMSYLTLSNKIGKLLISMIVSLLLLELNIIYVIWFLLVIAIVDLIVAHKIYKLIA